MSDRYIQTDFDLMVTKFSETIFQVVEWSIVVTVLLYAGGKLQLWVISAAAYVLLFLIACYIGVKASSASWWLFRLNEESPRKRRLISYLCLLPGALFSGGLFKLAQALVLIQ